MSTKSPHNRVNINNTPSVHHPKPKVQGFDHE